MSKNTLIVGVETDEMGEDCFILEFREKNGLGLILDLVKTEGMDVLNLEKYTLSPAYAGVSIVDYLCPVLRKKTLENVGRQGFFRALFDNVENTEQGFLTKKFPEVTEPYRFSACNGNLVVLCSFEDGLKTMHVSAQNLEESLSLWQYSDSEASQDDPQTPSMEY